MSRELKEKTKTGTHQDLLIVMYVLSAIAAGFAIIYLLLNPVK